MSDYRRETPLTGSWEFVTDPDEEGRIEGWAEPGAVWPDRAREVEVPHAWQELEAYRDYTGRAWYRRSFTADPGEDERVLLRFGAVDYETTVWVGGTEVGSNRGGYLPFALDATDAVGEGEVEVVVEVEDPEDVSEIPHGKQGEPWYHRVSGIWQDVTLEIVPETRVASLRATPDLAADAVAVETDVIGSGARSGALSASIEVRRGGSPVATADAPIERGWGSATIDLDNPDYWSPADPAIYDLRVTLESDGETIDRYEDYFGMRSVEVREGEVHLNGEPYPIRGALDQGYYPETFYRPFKPDLFSREVEVAKELGFNLLRKHIKPAHPDFLEAADRQGLLVWEEPANPTVHTERSRREVRDQLFGMIDRDYNRPSVVIWSLYNEEWGIGNPQGLDDETSLWEDDKKQEYLADLYDETREYDPTRVVCDNSGWAHVATDINDYHRYFVSPDRAGAWAADIESITTAPEENYAATETDPDDASLIVSEFGTWGMCDAPAIEEFYGGRPPWYDHEFLEEGLKRPAGYRDRFEESTLPGVFADWSDLATAWQWREYRSIKDVIERMRVHEGVDGYVITEFSDIEWEFNGILDYCREPKVFAEEFARINGERLLRIDLAVHALEAGGRLEADLVVVNDSPDRIEGDVEWSVFEESGTVAVSVPAFGVERVEDAIAVEVPQSETPLRDEVRVSHEGIPDNDEPITVVPEPSSDRDVAVYADEALASRLADLGFQTVDALGEADVAVVVSPDEDIREYAESGGRVVVVPGTDGSMADEEFFAYRSLPETDSWNLVASVFYADDLPDYVDRVPGWEFEGIYPYAVASDVEGDDVRLGSVEGWLSNWSAAVCTREVGDGRVTACTLRVAGGDDQPVARALLADLVAGTQ